MSNGLPADSVTFFREVNAIWPDLGDGRAIIAPVRNGVDRNTGKMLQGWDHVQQSLEILFETPFHQRVLRRWVGSFVPHLLGESGVSRVITRFFWAIVTSIDLFEPDFRVFQTLVMGNALNNTLSPSPLGVGTDINALYRLGDVFFQTNGVWYPRGHLNDYTVSSLMTAQVPLLPAKFVSGNPPQLPPSLPPQPQTGGI